MDGTPEDIEFRWFGNRIPVTVLIDDPIPARNPAWYEFPEEGHVGPVPHAFTERFADEMERVGAAGKFSVIPCPGARGCIDADPPGLSRAEIDQFVQLVRDRLAPRWDVSPELITHNQALDLATMQPLPEREDAWASHQDESTLTAYVERALQILRNVGLDPNGVTSPWFFGRDVEDFYVRAMVTALRDVCGVRVGWYFLHADNTSEVTPPRVMYLDPPSGTALVAIVSGVHQEAEGYFDFAWPTQYGRPANIETHLTADGSSGRLARLYARRSPIAFHTHWQSLFSNGRGEGLTALIELCERINRAWEENIRWTSAREIALYAAAREATGVSASDSGRRLTFVAPFPCPEFTFAVPMGPDGGEPWAGGERLQRLPDGDLPLNEGTWRRAGDRVLLCVSLKDGLAIEWRQAR
jgi:hypothetical protein